MQSHLVIQEREIEMAVPSKTSCLHFVETAPSVLRKLPWVVLREHTVSKLELEGRVGGEGREGVEGIVSAYICCLTKR